MTEPRFAGRADSPHCVVGSGPTGVAAATALLDHGIHVTMLDAGVECEPERLAVVHELSMRDPREWSAEDIDRLRGRPQDVHGRDTRFPRKLAYGSSFAYATDEIDAMRQEGTNCLLSFAKGGLSNVWGAAVLPNAPRDMDDWPLTTADLAPHYARIATLMPIAAAADELERMFPLYGPAAAPLRCSQLAGVLLTRMRSHRASLEAHGMLFGQSRLAVKTAPDDEGQGCRYTGLCLSGCPYFAIWNSTTALDTLKRRPEFTYLPGWTLDRIEPLPDRSGVRLMARAASGSGHQAFDARRAFLACGPISTMRIVIDSLRAYDRTLSLRFQPYFLLPLASLVNGGDIEHERLHTLAQLFLEIVDPEISPRTIHLQLYTFNEFIKDRVAGATRWLGPLRAPAGRALQRRLLAIQGYLHSSEAAPIRVTSAFDDRLGRARLTLTAPPCDRADRMVGRVVTKLTRHARQIGAVPLAPLRRMGVPGDGNHVGATFPIRRAPGDMETDLDGQLHGLPNVHIVDASSLPSLAATTFTYTAMAHAHRIADAVARRSGPPW